MRLKHVIFGGALLVSQVVSGAQIGQRTGGMAEGEAREVVGLQALKNAVEERTSQLERRLEEVRMFYDDFLKVVLLGRTGNGKTTLMHALCGDHLEIEGRGGRLVFQSEQRDIEHGRRSGTRDSMYRVDEGSKILFWDCPGLYDTRGLFSPTL